MAFDDTIAAISTPIGEGGIAIVRLSGSNVFQVLDGFVSVKTGPSAHWDSHLLQVGTVRQDGSILDEVLAVVMRAPRSYTGDNMAEVHCHGGVLAGQRTLDLALKCGARLAEPGEFTKRAFLNGRIDLTQAEAVVDIIRSSSDRALSAAVQQLRGRLSQKLEPIRQTLTEVLAHIEAHIDFPDEDIAPDTRAALLDKCGGVEAALRQLQATAREGKILREGVRVAIIGRPNVGKSSLLNALLGEERAIVTHIPGTTRDTVEEIVNIRGISIRLIDTAGLRHTSDHVEEAGVRRSRRAIELADVVLQVLDGSETLQPEDIQHRELVNAKPCITVINKSDLPQILSIAQLPQRDIVVALSAKTGIGLELLKETMESLIWSGDVGSTNAEVVINSRHEHAIIRTIDTLNRAMVAFRNGEGIELVAVDFRAALNAVGEITGHTTTEDILDKIFSTFCIGK